MGPSGSRREGALMSQRRAYLLAVGAVAVVAIGASSAAASSPWQVTATPDPGHNFGYQQRDIFAISSGGPTDTYAVLSYLGGVTTPTGSQELILHRVGSQWASTPAPTAPQGNGWLEWGSNVGAANAWLFGHQGQCGPAQCLWAVHHTSTGWSTAKLGSPPTNLQPGAVTAFGDHDIWQVGQDTLTQMPMASRWNGSSWASGMPPMPNGAVAGGLVDVAEVPGSSTVIAVGWFRDAQGEFRPFAVRHTGSGWQLMAATTSPRGEPAQVIVSSSGDAWLVGIRWGDPTHMTYKPLTEHWNGTSWKVVTPAPITGNGRLTSVSSAGGGALLAVGFRESVSGVDRTIAQLYRSGSWHAIASPNPSSTGSDVFYDSARVPGTSDVWAVGTDGQKITPAADRNTLAALYGG